ncbi:hypothetical protein ZIOFF_070386 [Zingiber officinale]|uniref:Uncharacterized protein n=1 Tax=Zingiber officinale TaxID=94328 RepID=A0A8J5C7R2_ZINOF|nr:hypothetical protein ZIOFF_070386 [Zingiber officinale]
MNGDTFIGCYTVGFFMMWWLPLVASLTVVLLIIPDIIGLLLDETRGAACIVDAGAVSYCGYSDRMSNTSRLMPAPALKSSLASLVIASSYKIAPNEKVPNFIKNNTTFIVCYVVGFFMIWRLVLVASPTMVLLVIPDIIYDRILMELARDI